MPKHHAKYDNPRNSRKRPRRVRNDKGRFRPLVEQLEDRRLLATFTELGSLLDIDLDIANEKLTVTTLPDGYILSLANTVWSGTNSVSARGSGTSTLAVMSADISLLDTTLISIRDSATGASVEFADSDSDTKYAASVEVRLDEPGASEAIFTGTTEFLGNAGIDIETTRNVRFDSGSALKMVDGDISIVANIQDVATSGDFDGIRFITSNITVTGSGDINLSGRGGNSSETHQWGVLMTDSSVINTLADGRISIDGVGSASTYGSKGVTIGSGSQLLAANGDIFVSGTAGEVGTASDLHGLSISGGAKVATSGLGNITLEGQGGKSSGDYNNGVYVTHRNTEVTTASGNITMHGQGGGRNASALNSGVLIVASGDQPDGATVHAGGSGNLTIVGRGGGLAEGDNNYGAVVGGGALASVDSGAVQVTGVGGGSAASGRNYGVYVNLEGVIEAGSQGSVTVTGSGGHGTGDRNYGVILANTNSKITSGGGDIIVTGQGGGSGTSKNNHGVDLQHSAQIVTGNTGTISVHGTGGLTTGEHNYGVKVSSDGTSISSSGGDVTVTGQGGGMGASESNIGVLVSDAARVAAGGNGTTRLNGTGGLTDGLSNHGISLWHENTIATSAGGDVILDGRGGGQGTSHNNKGIQMADSPVVIAGLLGNVVLTGVGGNGSGSGNSGVLISNNTTVTSSGGDVHVTGQGGGTAESEGNRGVRVSSGGVVTAGGTGNVTVTGTGGNTTGDENFGIYVENSGSQITSGGGNVTVTGQGGGTGESKRNRGVIVSSGGVVTAGGIGNQNAFEFKSGYNLQVRESLALVIPTAGGLEITDGETFAVNDGSKLITFEMDSNGLANPGNVLIPFQVSDSVDQVAAHIMVALSSMGMDLAPVNLGEGVIHIGSTIDHQLIVAGDTNFESRGEPGSIQDGGFVTVDDGLQHVTFEFNRDQEVLDSSEVPGVHKVVQFDLSMTHENVADLLVSEIVAAGLGLSPVHLGQGRIHVGDGLNHQLSTADSLLTDIGTGNVTVTGTGGNTTGEANTGILVEGSESQITSGGGNVTVTGQGGGTGESSWNLGVRVNSGGVVTAGGAGSVTVTGNGGSGTGGNNRGIVLWTTGTISSDKGDVTLFARGGEFGGLYNHGVSMSGTSRVLTVDGNLTAVGYGGGSGLDSDANHGIVMTDESQVASTGLGNIAFESHGGTSLGGYNVGLVIRTDSELRSNTGTIDIQSFAGTGTSSHGIAIADIDGGIIASAQNDINILTDGFAISPAGSITSGNNSSISIAPLTQHSRVLLGDDTSLRGAWLQLSDSELDQFNTPNLTIGNSTSGEIIVATNVVREQATNFSLVSAESIVTEGGSLNTGGGTLSLSSGSYGSLEPLSSGTDFTASTTTFGSDSQYEATINGTTVDTLYSQANITGGVNLSSAKLTLTGGYIPLIDDTFTIVQNDADDAITGTFAELPEGSLISFNSVPLQISYQGGTGNDVTLTAVEITPSINPVNDLTITKNAVRQTVPLTGIVAGSSASSPLRITTTSSNTRLISAVDVTYTPNATTGSLSFIPEAGMAGTTTITVLVEDGGLDNDLSTAPDNATITSSFEVFVTSSFPWHNYSLPEDVNNDGVVTAADVLTAINEINAGSGGRLSDSRVSLAAPFFDVNQDGYLTPLDVLVMINRLNDAKNQVALNVIATNAAGHTISSIDVGSLFYITLLAEDLNQNAEGVFAAYADVYYDSNLITLGGTSSFQSPYTAAVSGNTQTLGLIDEWGASASQYSPVGPGTKIIAKIPARAATAGRALLGLGAADYLPFHHVLVYQDTRLPLVRYGSSVLEILAGEGEAGDNLDIGGGEFLRTQQPLATNQSAVDALFHDIGSR